MSCFLSPSQLRPGSTSARFRCQDWYDAGNAPVAAEISYRWPGKPLQKTADLFKTIDSESKSLCCCSSECERSYREREENLAVMAGIEAKAPLRLL